MVLHVPIAAYGQTLAVSNEGSHDISVIDLGTRALVGRIAVGERPRGIHAVPHTPLIYVALSNERQTCKPAGRILVDLRTRKIVRRIPAGTDPEQFGVESDQA